MTAPAFATHSRLVHLYARSADFVGQGKGKVPVWRV